MTTALDRAVGSLVGLAVGDAVGTTLELCRRDSQPPLTDMVGGGPFRLEAGQWADDTSMALGLADSLLSFGELDPLDDRWCQLGLSPEVSVRFMGMLGRRLEALRRNQPR